MNRTLKTAVFWIVVVMSATLLWQVVRSNPGNRQESEITYSRFMSDVDAGSVEAVTIAGSEIHGRYREGKGNFRLNGPSDARAYLDTLRNKGIEIRFTNAPSGPRPLRLLETWAPLFLLGAMWLLMIRRMRGGRPTPPAQMPPGGGTLGPSDGLR